MAVTSYLDRILLHERFFSEDDLDHQGDWIESVAQVNAHVARSLQASIAAGEGFSFSLFSEILTEYPEAAGRVYEEIYSKLLDSRVGDLALDIFLSRQAEEIRGNSHPCTYVFQKGRLWKAFEATPTMEVDIDGYIEEERTLLFGIPGRIGKDSSIPLAFPVYAREPFFEWNY